MCMQHDDLLACINFLKTSALNNRKVFTTCTHKTKESHESGGQSFAATFDLELNINQRLVVFNYTSSYLLLLNCR